MSRKPLQKVYFSRDDIKNGKKREKEIAVPYAGLATQRSLLSKYNKLELPEWERVTVSTHEEQSQQIELAMLKNVQSLKCYNCMNILNGRFLNIVEGLEMHCNIFTSVEQKRLGDFILELQHLGKTKKLKQLTYSAPKNGKGCVTLQFGCYYKFVSDNFGYKSGIVRSVIVDPIPSLLKDCIVRLVRWRLLPPTSIPDSVTITVFEDGDCLPPHIDHTDFVRPLCILSLLSECDMVFGSKIKIEGHGRFAGPFSIRLPVGSVLVMNGNSANVAKHCVPSVTSKRISITFRKMDEKKRPVHFSHDPDLMGLVPITEVGDGPITESNKEVFSFDRRHREASQNE